MHHNSISDAIAGVADGEEDAAGCTHETTFGSTGRHDSPNRNSWDIRVLISCLEKTKRKRNGQEEISNIEKCAVSRNCIHLLSVIVATHETCITRRTESIPS